MARISTGKLRTLTAAGAVSRSALPAVGRSDDSAWQKQAWEFYDGVGELRYVCSWLTNALSRCVLVASDVNQDTGQPTGETENADVIQTVNDIAGGPAGQATLLGKLATYLTVPGDSWIAIIEREDAEEWHVLSTEEVRRKAGQRVELSLPDGQVHELDPEIDSLTRVYRPHPRNQQEPDSPVRAAIPILREIVRLGQYVEATAKSRLASNGILAVPSEMSLPKHAPPVAADPDAPFLPPPFPDELPELEYQYDEEQQNIGPEGLIDAMLETFSIAVQEPGSGAALAPIVLQGPGEQLRNIQHIKLGTEFTDTVMNLREAATRRLSLALDVPPEVLMGMAGTNHWSAWAIEESAIKLHVEPLLTLICDRLTEHVLWPLLRRQGHADPESQVIWYSTAGLSQKPNRTEEARAAWQGGAIGVEAYRREAGFDDVDAPVIGSDEQKSELARQLVLQDPSLLRLLAPYLGMDDLADIPLSQAEQRRAGGGERPPAGDAPAGDGPPAEPTSTERAEARLEATVAANAAAIRVAVTSQVSRRLELAGKRMRTRGTLSLVDGVPPERTHLHLPVKHSQITRLIADTGSLTMVAKLCGTTAERLAVVVDRVAAHALENKLPVERVKVDDEMVRWLLTGTRSVEAHSV